jgi:DNA-binding transcriptional regulator YhcF (GntR family)
LAPVTLDPDDPRPPYVQIANALRAAIRSRVLAPGEKLPSGAELAKRYGVARMTVLQAQKLLQSEGLLVSRQGTGVFVRERTERPVGLRPHIEQAFEAKAVTIDFAGFSGETLHGTIQEPLDAVRVGRYSPTSIRLRILLPDPRHEWTLPVAVDDLADDPKFRQRAARITGRHTDAIVDSVNELVDLGLIEDGSAEVRFHRSSPMFKLYLVNGSEMFFGFYPVREHTVTIEGQKHKIYDLMGKDTTLFHSATDDDPEATGALQIQEATAWFESMWNTVARPPD